MNKSVLLSVMLVFSFLSSALFAQEESREDILNAKEKALEGLVSFQKEKFKNGLSTYFEVSEAQIDLAKFKRDRVAALADKVKYQKELISILKDRKKMLEERSQGTATADTAEVIKAEIALLDGKLLLLELEKAAAQK